MRVLTVRSLRSQFGLLGGPMLAVCILIAVCLASLAVDFGHVGMVKTELQNPCDAAALAGAQDLYTDPDGASARALLVAAGNKANGLVVSNSSPGTTVTVDVTPPAGLLAGQTPAATKKGTGFVQPLQPHEHWHVDISYINIAGTFFYLCSLLDGYSRFIVPWELRESMTEVEVETIIPRARERFPDERPRIISDNGPQFIAKDFKDYSGPRKLDHPLSYSGGPGKGERWQRSASSTRRPSRPRWPWPPSRATRPSPSWPVSTGSTRP